MKKNVFFALFACAALVFVGCEPNTPTPTPDGGSTTDAVISVTPETLLMAAGETQKLTATVAPQGTQLQITWTSDNQEVVTVSPAGIVTAVAAGKANIIASAEGATADTCVVTVSNDAVLDNFVLDGYELFQIGSFIPGTESFVEDNAGNKMDAQLAMGLFYAWSDGIVFDGKQLSGAGFLFPIEAPVAIITEPGEFQGYWVPAGGVLVSDTLSDGVYEGYMGQGGKLVDLQKYGDAFKTILSWTKEPSEAVIEATYDLYESSLVGTQFSYVDFNENSQSYYYGNLTNAVILDDEEGGISYRINVEWFDNVNEGRFYGLAAEEVTDEAGETTTVTLVEPYDMNIIKKEYTNVLAEEVAPKLSAKQPKKLIQLSEDTKRVINETKKMYKK